MRPREMDLWAAHCGRCLRQDPQQDSIVLHPKNHRKYHIDMLLFSPSANLPFWKLCTMGASDYKLPLTFCERNEFIMFIHQEEDLHDREILTWYCDVLLSVALYPAENHIAVTFGHSMVWGRQEGTDMTAAFLDLPYPVKGSGVSNCRLGLCKVVHCLQVILLTQAETELLIHKGPQQFYDFLYPDGAPGHFLSERYRSEHF